MSWEQRKGTKRRYYLQSARVEGRVTKAYVGPAADPIVQVIAKRDALDRAAASAAVEQVRSEQARYRELERLLEVLAGQVQELQEVNLLACGYRWRKGGLQIVKYRDSRSPQSDEDVREEPLTREQFEHLARRANRGDPQAAHRLQRVIQENPHVWRSIGDLSKDAERCLINLMADGNQVLSESVRLRAEELRISLLGEVIDATLERMLVDHIVICWLDVEYTRMATVQPQQFKQDARFWAKKHDRANKRYLAAIKELGTLREAAARRRVPFCNGQHNAD